MAQLWGDPACCILLALVLQITVRQKSSVMVGVQRCNPAWVDTFVVYLCCRDPNAAQISQLRQQLAAARSEIGGLKRKLASSQDGGRPEFDSSMAPKSSDAIMALALDEMQQQNSALDVDNARLKVELVSVPMKLNAWHAQRSHSIMSLSCRAVLCLLHATCSCHH